MLQPPKVGPQPVVGFLLGFLSLLIALSYFSTEFANKSLFQAKTLSGLAQQKLQMLSANANHIFFSATRSHFSRISYRLQTQIQGHTSFIKHKGARTREMIVKVVQSNQKSTLLPTGLAYAAMQLATISCQVQVQPVNSPRVLNFLNNLPPGINKRTIIAL